MKHFQIRKAFKRIFSSASNIVMLSIIILLSVGLIASVVIANAREEQIIKANASISNAESEIAEANSKIDAANSQNSELQAAANELESQLGEQQNTNSSLEQQISELRQQMELLRAKKAAAIKAESMQAASPPTGEGKTCYLTFDDGPSENTLQILDILNQYNVKATFFVTNCGTTDYIRNIYDAGHSIGLHTATHDYKTIYSSKLSYFNDLENISGVVEQIIGSRPKIMRFPGGGSNEVSRQFSIGIMSELTKDVVDRGYSYFDWNVSSGDAEPGRHTPEQIRNNVLKGAANKDSICVLMHDCAGKEATVQALPEIITGLTELGFSFSAVTTETYGFHHSVHN